MPIDSSLRYIEPGSCTWCGHKPHEVDCTEKIRTGGKAGKDEYSPCPCRRHHWKKDPA